MTDEPLLVDTDTDRFAVLRDGAWVEFDIGDLIEAARNDEMADIAARMRAARAVAHAIS